jgi:hypothetical protein
VWLWKEAFFVNGLLWVIMSVATARLVRLFVDDTIIEKQRCWVLGHVEGKLHEMLVCPWCLSFWLSLPVVLLTWLAVDSMALPLLMFIATWWGACFAYWTTECLARYGNGD